MSTEFKILQHQQPDGAHHCGECSMCCKLLHIKELDKPAGVWCTHRFHGGCDVYNQRPQVCRDFECMWLQEDSMPDELRPDKSHCILWVNEDGSMLYVSVDPNYPNAWREGEIKRVLDNCYYEVPDPKIGIVIGKERFAYDPILTMDKEITC